MKNFSDQSWELEFTWVDIDKIPFPEEKVRKWILFVIESENNIPGYLNFIFCSDHYLHKINLDYLNHDDYTDIITFDYTEDFDSVSGDIFISIDRVKENSVHFENGFDMELYRIMCHGLLHLLGYKDKKDDEKILMTRMEDKYLKMIDFL